MLKRNGLKLSGAKPGSFRNVGCGNGVGNNESGGGVRLGRQILNRIDKFECLGSVVQEK